MNKPLNIGCIDVSSYKSLSQIARVRTEKWVKEAIFCPSCGSSITETQNNSAACDFVCLSCKEEFELKSKSGTIGSKIVNGHFHTLISRLNAHNNPNLYILNYQKDNLDVRNFFVVPNYFFIPSIIEERPPLPITAKRAGWVGCNILIGQIPEAGKIYYIKNQKRTSAEYVLEAWKKTNFLKNASNYENKSWLLDIMECIDKIGYPNFDLEALYKFENYLKTKHPNNNHIKDKIRQQLQILRDKGYLEFVSRGKYKVRL